jgi:hypothetical protein
MMAAFFVSLLAGFSITANAQAILSTDFPDYPPGSTVILTGSGFMSDETVTLQVLHADTTGDNDTSAAHLPWDIIADGSGSFVATWLVPDDEDEAGATLIATADGQISGLHAEVFFTDAPPAANLDQARNGGSNSPTSPVDFQNGNLGGSQAHYLEGHSVPYRCVMTNMPIGTSVTVTLEYDVKHGGHEALDYLTQYDRLLPHVALHGSTQEVVNPLAGLGLVSPTIATYPIPVPGALNTPVAGQPTTSFNALPSSKRVMTIYNGTITNIAYVTQGDLADATNQSATQINITFTPNNTTVVLAWGGHVASRSDWGYLPDASARSAGGISGSPYHMRLINWTLNNLGNQDRSLSTDASGPPPSCGITGLNPLCSGSTSTYQAVTDALNPSFSWSITGNASIVGSTTGQSVSVSSQTSGSFTLTVAITSGGVTNSCSQSVTIAANPTCNITGTQTICSGQSSTFTASGGTS